MSSPLAAVGRSWKAQLAVALSLAMTGSVLATGVFGVQAASADSAPTDLAQPATVTADSLPTTQINGVAWDQVIVGNTVYVAGEFTKARPAGAAAGVNETTRTNLLAYNLTTGTLVTTWAPTVNAQAKSISASADGKTIYVAGEFNQANNTTRNRVAAFDASTGGLTAFNPNVGGPMEDLAVDGSTVYLVGNFSVVGNQSRTRMAAVNATTGALLPWAPTADQRVRTVVVPAGSGKVIVGGHFTTLNGTPNKGIGALDVTTGALLPWAANQVIVNFGPDAAVYSLDTNGTSVFGVGYTFLVNNRPDVSDGNFEGTFSADTATGNINWITGCRGDHYDVGVVGDVVYDVSHTHDCAANGANPQTEPWTYQQATAWTTATDPAAVNNGGYFGGRPSPKYLTWAPTLTGGTYTAAKQAAWTIEGNSQYVVTGGEFPRVNGVAQYGLARFAVRSIAPNVQGPQGGTQLLPELVGISPGTLRVSWQAAWDRDNTRLTYEVLRGATLGTSVVVKTLTLDNNWWIRPKMSFTDTTAAAGSAQTYRIRVKDPLGNTIVGNPTLGTVPAGQASDSAYRSAVNADSPTAYWRLGEATGTTGYDQVGADDMTIESSAQRGQAGSLTNENSELSTTFDGNGSTPATTTGSATAGSQNFSVEAWFKTTTTNGGKIVGFGGSSSGNSGSYDRHLYMQNDGAVRFGVYDGNTRTIVTQPGLNNGQWHHAVGQMGPSGLKLYVDGKLIGSDVTATVAQSYSGFWRIGGDNIGGWPGQHSSTSFAGSIDEVAVYSGQLSQDQVRSHWLASGRAANWPIPPAAPVDGYGAAVWADSPNLFLRLDETSGSDAVDRTTNLTGANYFDGVTKAQAPSPAAAAGTAVSLDSGAARVVATEAVSNPQVFSQEVWFKTSTTDGGRIIGFGNSQNSQSNNYDRAAYMLNTGQIRYGVWTDQESTVVSPASYNDGAWHHLVVTQNVGEQRMYVDGTLVVSGSFGAPQNYTGYWRLGSDSMWGGANTQDFRGQLDEATVYPTALSAGRVLAHWTAAGGLAPNVLPTAAFSSATSFLNADLNGSASTDPDGSIVSYAWNFGDSSTGTGATPSHAYSAPGTYTVTLTVTDNRGATATISHDVTVVANVAPTASFTSSAVHLDVSFNSSSSADTDGTIVSRSWNFGDGATAVGDTAVHAYAAGGTYSVTLTVTDDQGATGTSTGQITVTAAPPANLVPIAAFTSSVNALTVDVDGTTSTDSDGTITGYAWNFGDGATATTPTATHTYATGGPKTVSLTVTDNSGATNTTTRTVTAVAPNVVPIAAFTSSTLGLGVSVDGTGSSDPDGSITGYSWDFGDGATAVGDTAAHAYAAGGTYSVTLTVTDNSGATKSVSHPVTVTAPPANVAPVAAFTSSSSNLLAQLNGSTSSDSDGTVVSYSWDFGDSSTGTGAATSHAYAAAGTFTVTLTVTDNQGATNVVSHPVTVTAVPPVTNFANDMFSRSVAGGFGTADLGGMWTVATPSAYSVSGGVGRLRLAAGTGLPATLESVQKTSVEVAASLSLDRAQTGGGTQLSVIGRRINASNDYRFKLKFAANGSVTAQLTRTVTGLETVLATTTVSGLTYNAGDVLNARFQVDGTGTTALKAKVWKAGTAEPAAWTVQGSDSSVVLQAPGSVGIWAYLSGSATTVPMIVSVDNFTAGPVA